MTLPSSGESVFNSVRLLGAGYNPCKSELNAFPREPSREQGHCCSAAVESLGPTPPNAALNPSPAAGDLHSPNCSQRTTC